MRALLVAVVIGVPAVASAGRPLCEVRITTPGQPEELRRYDRQGRLLASETQLDDGSKVERFTYDRAGHLIAVDAREQRTPYTPSHDTHSTSVEMTPNGPVAHTSGLEVMGGHGTPTGSRWQRSLRYDRSGRLVTVVDRVERWPSRGRGRTRKDRHESTRTYDQQGRLIRLDHEKGQPVHTRFGYDARGLLEERTMVTTDGEYRSRFSYDAAGRLESTALVSCTRTGCAPARTMRTTLDDAGRMTAYEDVGSRVTWTYGPHGMSSTSMLGASAASSAQVAFTYDLEGRVVSSRAGGSETTFAYSAACAGVPVRDLLDERTLLGGVRDTLTFDCVQSPMGAQRPCRSLNP